MGSFGLGVVFSGRTMCDGQALCSLPRVVDSDDGVNDSPAPGRYKQFHVYDR